MQSPSGKLRSSEGAFKVGPVSVCDVWLCSVVVTGIVGDGTQRCLTAVTQVRASSPNPAHKRIKRSVMAAPQSR